MCVVRKIIIIYLGRASATDDDRCGGSGVGRLGAERVKIRRAEGVGDAGTPGGYKNPMLLMHG
jgi:hypothetical protein